MPLLGSTEELNHSRYQIDEIVSPYSSSSTGLRDEVILTAWLLLLMRIQDPTEVSFEWRYESSSKLLDSEDLIQRLSPRDAILDSSSHVGQACAMVAGLISVNLKKPDPRQEAAIHLSTRSFSDPQEAAKDEQHTHFEVRRHGDGISIESLWHSDATPSWTVTRLKEILVETIKFCIERPSSSVRDCVKPANRDLDDIWSWNHTLPATHDFCMHEVISQQAQRYPDKSAISSWDGELTYSQVDGYSDIVARRLISVGVRHDEFVSLCFEKSRWTIVAVLGVMKAGGTLVMMDPSLPVARLQNMAKQTNIKVILSSRQQTGFSEMILPDGKMLIIEEGAFASTTETGNNVTIPAVSPSTIMYLIFTSGSTGTPKGVQISHRTYSSSALPRAKAVGYNPESRVLDFASYAFDVSIDSMLLTLGNGGCLCIPSDEDRMDDINGAIRRMKINYAGLTPSVARILDPDVIESLEGLGLGGEAASVSDVTLWGSSARIIIGYGPCECTIGCTINGDTATGRPYISIGTGNGAAIWVVDPNDHETLLPVGAVGELLVEGPIVGQGYLNDPEKTASVFIDPPKWLANGHSRYAGRTTGRLYKTGDLGKYDPDGSGGIVFVGRKDTQVKLRGQRVELGEIESQLNSRLPVGTTVIAEVIKPASSGGQPVLVAFVRFQSQDSQEQKEIAQVTLSKDLSNKLQDAQNELAKVLPRYMVPTAFIPVNKIPVLISGKTDRKVLRHFGSSIDLQQLDEQADDEEESRPLTDVELDLRRIWCEVLKLDEESVRGSDNFFSLGGDSLAAMKLVSACRRHGWELSVVQTFGNPRLYKMAKVLQRCSVEEAEDLKAFSLTSLPVGDARLEAAEICDVETKAVQDVYPCTPTQESLFTFSLRSIEAYIAQRVAKIPAGIDTDQLKQAWEHVVATYPILRTRLAQLSIPGLQQVILDEKVSWNSGTDLKQYLSDDGKQKLELGQALSRYAIIDNSADQQRYMVWTVHHVLYDGWSEPMILQLLSQFLRGTAVPTPSAYMKNFVHYLVKVDEAAQKQFWQDELKGATGPQFPRTPTRDYQPTPDGFVEKSIELKISESFEFTKATIVRAAWALLAARHTGSDDVVFGETMTGRDIPVAAVECIIGPMIATIPMRVNVQRKLAVRDYLLAVQNSVLARIPYQHMGMQNIRRVSPDAQYACEAGTGLVIQPEPEYDGNDLGFARGDPVREALHFNPYPLMLAFGLRESGLRVCASFDSSLIPVPQMEHMLSQLEVTCQQLLVDMNRPLADVSSVPDYELDQIWEWNRDPPLLLNEASGLLQAGSNVRQGSLYPRVAIPWVCEAQNPDILSPLGSTGELWFESQCLIGESSAAPSWLKRGHKTISGRSTSMKAAGDLVQIQLDGSIHFVGRKDGSASNESNSLDLVELERQAAEFLPEGTKIVAALGPSMGTEQGQSRDGEPVILIEAPSHINGIVEVFDHSLRINNNKSATQLKLATKAPAGIVSATKKLDKFIVDSLPWVSSTVNYLIVEALPTDNAGQTDCTYLKKSLLDLDRETLVQARKDIESAWAKTTASKESDGPSEVLRSAWAEILGLPKDKIDTDDNFFRLGGDSVLAMKLVSKLRTQGHVLSVAQIFQNMRLGDAARVMKLGSAVTTEVKSYKLFSLLGQTDYQSLVSTFIGPKLAQSSWSVSDVLPATDIQVMDVRATITKPRTSLQYTTLIFNNGIDTERLENAYNELVQKHDILRTVFVEHESSIYQVVLKGLESLIDTQNFAVCDKSTIDEVCRADAEKDLALGAPFAKAFLIRGENGSTGFVLRLSHAQYDGTSLPRLLQDLEALYTGAKVKDFVPFPQYVSATKDETLVRKAQRYWRHLLDGSKISSLERTPSDAKKGLFLSKEVTIASKPAHITTSTLLTAGWAVLLSRRLFESDITFGAVTTGRSLDLPNAESVVGPCYNIMPIRIRLQPSWKASDLLDQVQAQVAKSASYDFLGFSEIKSRCSTWSESTEFFNSIVHHQDFDDFDEMPFAGTSCEVDLLNPFGDAAEPFKAVTFQRNGQLNVGVVGYESEKEMCESVLEELARIIVELVE